MKKVILVLTIAFMFVAGTAFSATINCIMYSTENDGSPGTLAGQAGPPITADYTFTIETDASGNITHFTDLWSNYFYTSSAGGWDPRDGGAFAAGEQVFPNGVQQTVSVIAYAGGAGTTNGLWFKGQSNPTGVFGGLVFNVGLLAITYDSNTDIGIASFGPSLPLQEQYVFHAVPIPAAVWLLLSGLVGIIGIRRRK